MISYLFVYDRKFYNIAIEPGIVIHIAPRKINNYASQGCTNPVVSRITKYYTLTR